MMTKSGRCSCTKIRKAEYGFGQDEVLCVAFALVHEFEEVGAGKALYFQPRFAVATHHVHASDEEAEWKNQASCAARARGSSLP